MRLCSIASGSSGNCIFAGSETTSLLFDAWISGKRIEAGIQAADRKASEIDAIFLTHEHSDHIGGVGVMARRYARPIYATAGTLDALRSSRTVGEIPEDLFHVVRADEPVQIGDLVVRPFSISHDAAEPVGYRLENGGKSAAIATDMGYYDDYTIRQLRDLDLIFLEANHDVNMLQAGRYPYYLKQRILGNRGHLSNETAGRLLNEVLHDDISRIVLAHLSRENNYPALAFETVCAEVTMGDTKYKANDFRIEVAKRDETGAVMEI